MNNKLMYKKNLRSYLNELGHLTKRTPGESELLSLEFTEEERARACKVKAKASLRFEINFKDKNTPKFEMYINSLYVKNPSPIYIWTERSNYCGIFEIPSILEFNFNFNFDVNSEGIIVLLSKNMADKMILDFSPSVSDLSQNQLEIELLGDNWPLVTY